LCGGKESKKRNEKGVSKTRRFGGKSWPRPVTLNSTNGKNDREMKEVKKNTRLHRTFKTNDGKKVFFLGRIRMLEKREAGERDPTGDGAKVCARKEAPYSTEGVLQKEKRGGLKKREKLRTKED